MSNNEHSVAATEPRLNRKVRMGQIAACLCAFFAALGIGFGMYEANPNGGWVTPVLAGVVAATTLALFWHVVIGAVGGMVRLSTIIAMFTVATLVTVIALGASAQAIATAIAGRSALSAELALKIDAYDKTLASAYAQSTRFHSVAVTANETAAGLKTQADRERNGSYGQKGCGPKCTSLEDISTAFTSAYTGLSKLLAEAGIIRDNARKALGEMRTAASRSDQMAFMAAAEVVVDSIARLNAIDPKPIIDNTGAVMAKPGKGYDLTEETKDFRTKAAIALADRKSIEAPKYSYQSLGEATRQQVFGSAAHGWIIAGAIDILPLIFMIAIFVLSREVWSHEEVERRKVTSFGLNARDRGRLDDLRGKSPNNVVKLSAAE